MDRIELTRMQDEAIMQATATGLRLSKEIQQARLSPSFVNHRWFPWAALPYAMVLGTAIALLLPG